MYKSPSQRRTKKELKRLDLIPILDSTFIFIFFLLMSANFIKIYEISSNVPIITDKSPPKDEKPLALTLKINTETIEVATGVPSKIIKSLPKTAEGKYDLEELHAYLLGIKQNHVDEKTIIFEPEENINYEEIVNIMDAVRLLRDTDPSYYTKDINGVDIKVKELFDNIVMGNIRS